MCLDISPGNASETKGWHFLIFQEVHLINTLSLPPHSETNTQVSGRNILSEALKTLRGRCQSPLLSAIPTQPGPFAASGTVFPRTLRQWGGSAGESCTSAVRSSWPRNSGRALAVASPLPRDCWEHMPDLIWKTKCIPFNWNFVHEEFIKLDSDAAEKQW